MAEPAPIRIDCVERTGRSAPWDRIASVGGRNPTGSRWKLSHPDAIARIQHGIYAFYVEDDGRRIAVVVDRHSGRRYLKGDTDNKHPNALLALPDCT